MYIKYRFILSTISETLGIARFFIVDGEVVAFGIIDNGFQLFRSSRNTSANRSADCAAFVISPNGADCIITQ